MNFRRMNLALHCIRRKGCSLGLFRAHLSLLDYAWPDGNMHGDQLSNSRFYFTTNWGPLTLGRFDSTRCEVKYDITVIYASPVFCFFQR